MKSVLSVFTAFLKLGLTSFGGPIAHLGYFREEFVVRKKWVEDRVYADLVALCQFTPGPASSKVGIAIGLAKAGLPGALVAWLGFTLPSALALLLFAYGVETFASDLGSGWLHGLKVVAVAVVAQAVWGMAKNLTPDAPRLLSSLRLSRLSGPPLSDRSWRSYLAGSSVMRYCGQSTTSRTCRWGSRLGKARAC